jgi:5-methyltetrahydropteroyltriglutamate--homocysteine methyltransferase
MKRSVDRMLTTHVGSLARPAELIALARAKDSGQPYDHDAFEALTRTRVAEVVHRQADLGLDIVADGEQGRSSFAAYIGTRLGGFEVRPPDPADPAGAWRGTREDIDFPEYYQRIRPTVPLLPQMVCVGPITYEGRDQLQDDLANLTDALQGQRYEEAFVTSISTTNVEGQRRNEYYATEEEFLEAIADAMHEEYRAIVDAGFLLQIDDPRFSTYYTANPDKSVEECRAWAEQRVDVLNHALRGIAPERVRFHTCYSIDVGPRIHDMELKHIVDIMLKVNAGAYSFEASNPRHEHEYQVWEHVALPDDKVLLPGVISHTTNLVEHPELIAQRVARYAGVVGRERVIASADCGFAASAREVPDIDERVAWAKLASLVEGASLATKELWE